MNYFCFNYSMFVSFSKFLLEGDLFGIIAIELDTSIYIRKYNLLKLYSKQIQILFSHFRLTILKEYCN